MALDETQKPQNPYNDEPVYYCKRCLSLRVMNIDGYEFCDKCTAADIGTASIEEWERMYEERYKHKFINK